MPKEFNISPTFEGSYRDVVEAAVKASTLPEGINVVRGFEIDKAEKPFVVVTLDPDWREARSAFMAGAINYVTGSMDVKKLTDELNK